MNAYRSIAVAYRASRITVLLASCMLVCGLFSSVAAQATTHVFSTSFGAAINPLSSPANPYPLSTPTGVAVDNSGDASAGDVYVSDLNNNWVEKFSAAGNLIWVVGGGVDKTTGADLCTVASGDECEHGVQGSTPGKFTTPKFLAVDDSTGPSQGDLYVGDAGDGLVSKFTADGTLVQSWGTEGQLDASAEPGGPFGSFTGIAVDSAGNLIVNLEQWFFKFAPDGTFTEEFFSGGGSDGGFAVNSLDDIYALRRYGREEIVTEYNPFGDLLGIEVVAPEPATGVAVDTSNDEFYVDKGIEIARYSSANVLSENFGSTDIAGATGLAVDFSTNGSIYVADTTAGRVEVFSPFGPFVTTGPATNLGGTSATLVGRVAPNTGGALSGCHFEYVDEAGYNPSASDPYQAGQTIPCLPAVPISSSTHVSAVLTGLNPGTTYHFRLSATDANATNYSADSTFLTEGPIVASQSVTDVSSTSVTFDASINPNGDPTTYYFQYGQSASYGEEAPVLTASEPRGAAVAPDGGEVSQHTQVGLAPDTAYHYRVVAVNVSGTDYGPDGTFTTQAVGGPLALLDNRQWELVSPPDKHGANIEPLQSEGGVTQASSNGGAITYVATGPVDGETTAPSDRAPELQQVYSKRGTAGWETQDIASPHEKSAPFAIGQGSEYQFFSEDLSLGLLEPRSEMLLSSEASEATPYLRELNDQPCNVTETTCYTPLVTGKEGVANIPPGTKIGEPNHVIGLPSLVKVAGTSADLKHVVLTSKVALTSTPFANEGKEERELYEWTAGKLELVSTLPGDGETPAKGPRLGYAEHGVRNAISNDGSRVIWEDYDPSRASSDSQHHLYVRDTIRHETVKLDAVQAGVAPSTEDYAPEFQFASADGSRIFFTDDQPLVAGSHVSGGDQSDLYECEMVVSAGKLTCDLSDLTITSNPLDPAETGDVQDHGGVLGGSENGAYVYFIAKGILAPGAISGANNVYVSHYGITKFISSHLEEGDSKLQSGETGGITARVSPDGQFLAFMSDADLTGYDNRDAVSGVRDEEVFLYDAETGHVVCVSCNPSGARPVGLLDTGSVGLSLPVLADGQEEWGGYTLAGSIPGWTTANGNNSYYQSRYLTNEGRVFFNSPDALVPQDINGFEDVYEYEPQGVGTCREAKGCVGLISSGTSAEESAFLDAGGKGPGGEEGEDVFFLTSASLLPQDYDRSFDVYDAHTCSAAAPCLSSLVAPPACTTADSCRAALSAQPAIFGPPPSATFSGAGNITPVAQRTNTASTKSKLTRAQKLSRALAACRKRPKRVRMVCKAQARKRYGGKTKTGRSGQSMGRKK